MIDVLAVCLTLVPCRREKFLLFNRTVLCFGVLVELPLKLVVLRSSGLSKSQSFDVLRNSYKHRDSNQGKYPRETKNMGNTEWAMWANEQGVIASVGKFMYFYTSFKPTWRVNLRLVLTYLS